MTHALKTIAVMGSCLGLLLLSACGAPTPTSTSTPDLDPFRTEVASTVLAEVTRDLALTPSATQVPSATATLAPTDTPALTATLSPSPQQSGTPGTPGVATNDLAEWVAQSVSDGTIFAPGETFIITWTLKNTGTSTWTPFYLLRFFSGQAFGAPQEIFLDRDVLPGETIDISVAMQAPATPGEYRSDWVMANEFRSNFKEPVYLVIEVARPPTSTPTPTVTPTATRTPTVTATP